MTKMTILTGAVTGNLMTPEFSPHPPVILARIAEQVMDASTTGPTIMHLHVRDPETTRGSTDIAPYRELESRIREKNDDIILNLTTGEGGRFVPSSSDDPKVAAPGSTLCAPEKRVANVEDLRPETCTLDFNTMWSGQASVINATWNLEAMAAGIYAAGVTPEIGVFDSGDLHMVRDFIARGIIKTPLMVQMVQMVLGVRFGALANSETMAYLVGRLPPKTQWTAFGIGKAAFAILAQAFLLGGHVRIGMEDTAFIRKGEYCTSNAQLVENGVSISDSLWRAIETPDQARNILGIRARK